MRNREIMPKMELVEVLISYCAVRTPDIQYTTRTAYRQCACHARAIELTYAALGSFAQSAFKMKEKEGKTKIKAFKVRLAKSTSLS